MAFKILADTFSVARDPNHFIQLKTIKKPRSEEQGWLAVEVDGETKYARSLVQNMIETLEEVFFASTELSSYERFENALKEINLILKNLKEKRGPKSLGEVSAIIAVGGGGELHLTQSKRAEAYLVRRGKLSLISEGLGGRSEDIFVNIASGELMPDDKIIFATSRLLRLATHSQLVQILSEGVTEAVDAMRELVMGENELSMGVMCLHIKLPQRAGVPEETSPAWLLPFKEGIQKIFTWLGAKVGKRMPALPARIGSFRLPKLNLNRKGILVAILGVVFLLIVSVSLLMDSRRNEALRTEYRSRVTQLDSDLAVANTKGYSGEKETANAILDKVEREARDILGAHFFRDEVMILLDKVQTARDSINNTIRLKEAKPYVDLTGKKPTVKALGMLHREDRLFVYEYNTLFEVILDQVLDPRIIDETEVITTGTAMEDQGRLIFLTRSGRVLEYEEEAFNFANTDDPEWQEGTDLVAYGRNIYLLNPLKNQIYKYSRLHTNYSNATEYNTDADLANAIGLAVDGNMYVLKQGGEILKLFKSKVQPFEIEDLAVDLTDVSQIYTSLELNHLYLLDPVNNRVVIVEKDRNGFARYTGQVVFENLGTVNDLIVNKNEDKLYLLTDTAIYQVEL